VRDWSWVISDGCDARGKSIRDYPIQGKVFADFDFGAAATFPAFAWRRSGF
jgi:hypothetical protein